MLCIYLLIKIQAQSLLSLVKLPQFMFTTLLFPPIKRLVRLVGNNVHKAFWVVCCICPYTAMRMRNVQDSVLKKMTKFQDMF